MTLDFAGTTCSVSQKAPSVSRAKQLLLGALVVAVASIMSGCAGLPSKTTGTQGTQAPSIAITPLLSSISSRGMLQFAASVSNSSSTEVTWSASAGAISSSGLFTAPLVNATTQVTILATSVASGSIRASATITVTPGDGAPPAVSVSISPTSATVLADSSQQFTGFALNTGNTAVKWAASAGSISSSGLFTAPPVTSSTEVAVTATSVADSTKQAVARVIVMPASTPPVISIAVAPTSVTLLSNASQQFTDSVSNTSDTAVRWVASAGSISSSGLFTAPSVTTATQVTVTATSVADASKHASATVTVKPASTPPGVSISIAPTSISLLTNASQQFAATVSNTSNTAVKWSSSAGTISGSGLFTAPSVTATTEVTVTATSVADASKHAIAEVTVKPVSTPPAVTISIAPTSVTLLTTASKQFTATVSNTSNTAVKWAASAGSISTGGLFTAPSVTATTQIRVTATSVADSTKTATASVTVSPSSPSGPTIVTSAIPSGVVARAYSAPLLATGGHAPYHWGTVSGTLPEGISVNSASGAVVGLTTATGTFSFNVQVTDANAQSATHEFTLLVTDGNQPGAIPSSYFGMHVANIVHFPASYAGALGKASAVYWPWLEPQRGVFNWSRLDAWVNTAERNGVPFYFSNDYVPEWAAADTSTCSVTVMDAKICTSMVANIQDWDNFVTALVNRYKGKIQMYELWNEPNNSWYFSGTMQQMVTLTNHMYNIVREVDPKALIASPSAADSAWMDSYWAAGGVTSVDIVTTHDYPDPTNPVAEIICGFRSVPLKQIMSKYGIQKPVWDTEGSWGEANTLSDPNLQAAYVSRNIVLHWACGVPRFFWYAWDGGNPAWGLLWTPSGLDQAGVAFENVEIWLNGATMPNNCQVNGGAIPAAPGLFHGVYSCQLTRPNGYEAQVVWNTDGTSTYTAPGQFTQYRDIAGYLYEIPSNRQVPIGIKPILLEN